MVRVDVGENVKVDLGLEAAAPIGNPQDKFCREAGGVSSQVVTNIGREWLCVFNNGSECPAAAMQDGTCKAGDNPLREVKIFLGNKGKNPNAEDCGLVYPVTRRVGALSWTEYETVLKLLEGVSAEESKDNYYSSINSGVGVLGLRVTDGVARVNFNSILEEKVGGSCRVIAIRAQIEETLKQFTDINEVEIAVDGRIEDVLQP